jgi:hypothetical protein
MFKKFFLVVVLVLAWPIFGQELVNDCNSCIVMAQTGHSAALTWTLSTDDTTTACAVTGANCSQAVYRGPGACSATSTLTALNSSLSATATSYTDTTITPGQYCYAVSFTIGSETSVIYASGNTNFSTVSLLPAVPASLSVVVH